MSKMMTAPYLSKQQLDAIRKLLLGGELYNDCVTGKQVSKERLQQRLQ